MFIDSHAHYDIKQFDQNRWQLLAKCKRQNIGKMLIPLHRIMMETDAPYVKPAWCTDPVNTSLTIPRMAEELACIKGIELEEVERVTTENAEKVFLAKVANPSDIRQP